MPETLLGFPVVYVDSPWGDCDPSQIKFGPPLMTESEIIAELSRQAAEFADDYIESNVTWEKRNGTSIH